MLNVKYFTLVVSCIIIKNSTFELIKDCCRYKRKRKQNMKIKIGLIMALMMGSIYTTKAQQLYADNVTYKTKIELTDSSTYLYSLMNEQEDFLFPELDMDENWSTDQINPYKVVDLSQLPDSIKVNVSNFAIPIKQKKIRVTSNFGYRRRFGRFHFGTDLDLVTGDTVYAAFDGKIRIRKYDYRGYGKYYVIRHKNGLETIYGHLSRYLVNVGDEVKAGDPIGLGGNTGRSFGSHLHFEVRILGKAFDSKEIFDYAKQDVYKDYYVVNIKNRRYRSRSGTTALASSKSKVKYTKGFTYHRVKSGDTLGGIAKRNHTTVSALCRLNKISRRTVLRIGTVLRCS